MVATTQEVGSLFRVSDGRGASQTKTLPEIISQQLDKKNLPALKFIIFSFQKKHLKNVEKKRWFSYKILQHDLPVFGCLAMLIPPKVPRRVPTMQLLYLGGFGLACWFGLLDWWIETPIYIYYIILYYIILYYIILYYIKKYQYIYTVYNICI